MLLPLLAGLRLVPRYKTSDIVSIHRSTQSGLQVSALSNYYLAMRRAQTNLKSKPTLSIMRDMARRVINVSAVPHRIA